MPVHASTFPPTCMHVSLSLSLSLSLGVYSSGVPISDCVLIFVLKRSHHTKRLIGMASFLHSKTEKEAATPLDSLALEQVFGQFDVDGDGRISPAELRLMMMRTVGEELNLEEAEAVVRSADKDGDGLLDLEEFAGLVAAEGEEVKERELREAFGMYEMEGEECITAGSLKRMLSRLGASRELEECRAMICRFDLNGDGVLSFDEFKVMMMSS